MSSQSWRSQRRTAWTLMALVLATFAIAVISLVVLRLVVADKDRLAFDYTQQLIDVAELRVAIEQKVAHSRGYLISSDESLLRRIAVARQEFLRLHAKIAETETSNEGRERLAEIASRERQHEEALAEMVAAKAGGASAAELGLIFESSLRPKRLALEAALDAYLARETAVVQRARQSSVRTAEAATATLGLVSLAALAIGAYLSRALFKSMRKAAVAEESSGDLLARAEAAHRRFLDLVDHLDHSAVWEAFAEPFRITYISERSQLLFGLPPKELISNPDLFFRYVFEEDRESLKATVAKAVETMRDQRCDHRMYSSEGTLRWVQTGVHAKQIANGRIQLYGITVDISPLKRFEGEARRALKDLEDFKFALDASSIVAITDRQGTITYVNDRFCEISKYGRQELIGANHRILNSGVHSKAFFKELWRTIGAGKVWRGDICNRAKDGSLYWVQTFIVPFLDESGKPYQYLAIRTDITERKMAERRQEALIQSLESEREVRERFVSMLTHDLRTPLAAAKMGAQLISRQCGNPAAVANLSGRVIESLGRTEEMIRDLLDANRIQAGKPVPLQIEKTDVTSLVKDALHELALVHGDRFRFHDGESVHARVDRLAVRRILENLAINAVKYGRADSEVVVELRPGETVFELSVTNQGNPLSPEERDSLFAPFHRTKSAQSSGSAGWGLGLTLVKGLTQAMGGQVSVSSEPAQGTSFIVRIPYESAIASAYELHQRPAEAH